MKKYGWRSHAHANDVWQIGCFCPLHLLVGDCLTFIEVRFRATPAVTPASHTVDRHKQRKIIRTAAHFITRNRRYATFVMRFDVVAIEGSEAMTIEWIADAFRPNDSTF